MNRGGATYGRGADDEGDLDVIDLEPPEPARARRDPKPTTEAARRRGPVIIAVVVVAALVVSAIADRSRGSNRATPTTTAPDAARALDQTPLFSFRVGAQVLTGGATGLTLIDTDTGRTTTAHIDGLPQGPTVIAARSGGTVAVRVGTQLYWFTMHERRAQFADAVAVFPAVRRGYLWFASARFASEVPGAPHATKTSGRPIGATSAGLLVATDAGVMLQPTTDAQGRTPNARPLLRAPATVLGVHPDRVAWMANDCGPIRCPIRVTEVATGATSTWLQLVGTQNPLVVAGTSAEFSPDGTDLAVVAPDQDVTMTATLIVADLRSRATTVLDALGRFDEPARPGSDDATGTSVEWTLDGRFLLLAPATGPGSHRVSLVDPGTGLFTMSSGPTFGSTIAVIGTSSRGPLDLPRHGDLGPVDSGGPTPFGTRGLDLVGADEQQVDVLDLSANRMQTFSAFDSVVLKEEARTAMARVGTGWLVTRDEGVYLFADGAPREGGRFVAFGSQVFSANHGRTAWIAAYEGANYTVAAYDPGTGLLGAPISVAGVPVGAVDAGAVVVAGTEVSTHFAIVEPDGTVRRGPELDVGSEVLAAAGSNVVFRDELGLHVYDVAAQTTRDITAQQVLGAALSPDGGKLAWIDGENGPASKTGVRALDLSGTRVVQLAAAGDRVLVADDGEVLFTKGFDARKGRVDTDGSSPLFGLAPNPDAILGLS